MVQKGKNQLLDWQSSPWYKERLKNNGLGDIQDELLRVTDEVPIDYSYTYDELGAKGVSNYPNASVSSIDENGWKVVDKRVQPYIQMSYNTPETERIPIHELLHAKTSNITDTNPLSGVILDYKNNIKTIERGALGREQLLNRMKICFRK